MPVPNQLSQINRIFKNIANKFGVKSSAAPRLKLFFVKMPRNLNRGFISEIHFINLFYVLCFDGYHFKKLLFCRLWKQPLRKQTLWRSDSRTLRHYRGFQTSKPRGALSFTGRAPFHVSKCYKNLLKSDTILFICQFTTRQTKRFYSQV